MRNASRSRSSSAQIRDTSDLEIPLVAPRAFTRSSTLRVLTPWTQASMTTANRARSIRRRRSNSDGKKLPVRSLGICSSMSPAAVVTSFGRCPLRWAVRASVRSCGAALIVEVSSASISCWSTQASEVRMVSVMSPAWTATSNSDRSDSARVTGVVSFV